MSYGAIIYFKLNLVLGWKTECPDDGKIIPTSLLWRLGTMKWSSEASVSHTKLLGQDYMKGKPLAPGKGDVWSMGFMDHTSLKSILLFFFSPFIHSWDMWKTDTFQQRRHSKVSLFQGQNENKHAGHWFPEFPIYCFHPKLSDLTTRFASVSHLGLLFSRVSQLMCQVAAKDL